MTWLGQGFRGETLTEDGQLLQGGLGQLKVEPEGGLVVGFEFFLVAHGQYGRLIDAYAQRGAGAGG
jgi:hypothetical protein